MPQIQKIEASRVVHELILKPLGTYLIRSSTENDDILSQIKIKSEIESSPYVVLSVRVDENDYYCPIMNYRLPFIESNDEQNLIEYYKQIQNNSKILRLPELEKECIIETENTDWNIDEDFFQTQYMHMYLWCDKSTKTCMTCNTQYGNNEIKVFKKAMKNNEQEFSILKTLSYFHIVTFYGISNESDQMKYLIFADNGESLKIKYSEITYIDDLMTKQLSMIGYQIACGMIYLESKHIIHRDLHAGNILIDEQNIIRIADFEHAIIKDDDNDRFQQSIENSNLKFKIRRLAPECLPWPPETEEAINSNENILTEFSSKSDVWAYGLIFIELIIGTNNHVYPYLPQPDNDDVDNVEEHNQLIEYVKLGGNIHEKPHNCPEDLYNICKQCWEYYRDDRISFMDVRNEMLKLFKSKQK